MYVFAAFLAARPHSFGLGVFAFMIVGVRVLGDAEPVGCLGIGINTVKVLAKVLHVASLDRAWFFVAE
jgi:hypothetical protein